MSAPPPRKRLYTLAEAADYLGRSVWSIRRLIWGGVLPSVRVQGRVHIDVADMDELIERSKCMEEAGVGIRKMRKVTYGAVSAKE